MTPITGSSMIAYQSHPASRNGRRVRSRQHHSEIAIKIAADPALINKVNTPAGRTEFVQQYCVACHNVRAKTGGLVLEGMAAEPAPAHADIWEKVVKRLGAGEMPPRTMTKRPDPQLAQAMVAGLVHDLDTAARTSPYAGRTVLTC